jgi:hypothetical protein
VVMFRVGILV